MVAAQEFPETLREIIDESTYLSEKVFNVDETRLDCTREDARLRLHQ